MIAMLVTYFIIYIILHLTIGYFKKEKEEQLFELQNTKGEEYEAVKKQIQFLGILFTWFPAAYVVVLLIVLL